MAHFFDPYTGSPLGAVDVVTDGQTRIALWGGGPPPDFNDLNITFVPSLSGAISQPLDLGGNRRMFWINSRAGTTLHALDQNDNDYAQPLTITRVGPYHRNAPPSVAQNRDLNECWAAALASWLMASGKANLVSVPRGSSLKRALVDKYSDLEDDGISEEALTGQVVKDFGMGWWGNRTAQYKDLRPSGLIGRLKHSYLFFIYKSGFQSSHSLCVYGIGCASRTQGFSNPHREPMIVAMDPWYGLPYARPCSEFYGKPLFIGWSH